jgi:hypothetical protein
MPAKNPVTVTTVEEKLDEIILHLQRLDRRDRLRTIGAFLRSLLSIVWILLIVWSGWYFVAHWSDIMKQVANQAASSAAEYTQQKGTGLLDQFKNQYNYPNK